MSSPWAPENSLVGLPELQAMRCNWEPSGECIKKIGKVGQNAFLTLHGHIDASNPVYTNLPKRKLAEHKTGQTDRQIGAWIQPVSIVQDRVGKFCVACFTRAGNLPVYEKGAIRRFRAIEPNAE